MFSIRMWVAALILVVTLPGVLGEMIHLMVKAGEKVSLPTGLTGLDGDYLVVWYLKSGAHSETLIQCSKARMELDPPKRFEGKLHMDATTGNLTIGPLSIKDSSVYHGDIIDGNHRMHRYTYNVTVLEAVGFSCNAAADHRIHLAGVFAAAVCIMLFTSAVHHGRTGENCSPTCLLA